MAPIAPAPLLRRIVAAVVGIAALLLIVDIALALLVARRSGRIRDGLEDMRRTTADLRRVAETTSSLERMIRRLRALRRETAG